MQSLRLFLEEQQGDATRYVRGCVYYRVMTASNIELLVKEDPNEVKENWWLS